MGDGQTLGRYERHDEWVPLGLTGRAPIDASNVDESVQEAAQDVASAADARLEAYVRQQAEARWELDGPADLVGLVRAGRVSWRPGRFSLFGRLYRFDAALVRMVRYSAPLTSPDRPDASSDDSMLVMPSAGWLVAALHRSGFVAARVSATDISVERGYRCTVRLLDQGAGIRIFTEQRANPGHPAAAADDFVRRANAILRGLRAAQDPDGGLVFDLYLPTMGGTSARQVTEAIALFFDQLTAALALDRDQVVS